MAGKCDNCEYIKNLRRLIMVPIGLMGVLIVLVVGVYNVSANRFDAVDKASVARTDDVKGALHGFIVVTTGVTKDLQVTVDRLSKTMDKYTDMTIKTNTDTERLKDKVGLK